MKISTKLVVSSTLLCTLAVIATGTFVGWRSFSLSEQALQLRAFNQLISVREIKKSEIENYFNNIVGQVVTTANSVGLQNAIIEFSNAFANYPIQQVSQQDTESLKDYYKAQFGATYRSLNEGKPANEMQRFNQLSPIATVLQARYIGTNKHALGEKHLLISDSLNTNYDQVHRLHHPSMKLFLEEFGYYDIFLVDTAGNIVYSVFKELDFATNLNKGPYANSGIAHAYQRALTLNGGGFYLDDFKPYYPSYEAVASFISTPIVKNGETLGVLIFQMPVDEINKVMTFKKGWATAGLGLSGETYLIGQDNLMRSEPRLLLEDPDAYFKTLRQAGVGREIIEQIKNKSSAIGRQSVSTLSAKLALNGQSGSNVINNHNIDLLSAYSPVNIAGLEWAIITEIYKGEALKDLNTMTTNLVIIVFSSIVFVIVIVIVFSYFFGNSIAKPIRNAICKIEEVSNNNDLSLRLAVCGSDETSDLANSFNKLMSHLQEVIGKFAQAASNLDLNTQSMSGNMDSAQKSVSQQSHRTESVATAVNQMSASISDVSQFASNAAGFVKQANEKSLEGMQVGQNLGEEISRLSAEMQTAVTAIERLSHEADSIAEVLDVIQSIAEQTNLLALNAAIEAARAGEQGRGFAVVADEVRTLASRTQSSTEEIRNKIDLLQKETNSVSSSIENANKTVGHGVLICGKNTEMLQQVVTMINELNEMNIQIATATDEQRAVTDDISSSITSIADSSSDVNLQVKNVGEVLQKLSDEANKLNKEVSQFKI